MKADEFPIIDSKKTMVMKKARLNEISIGLPIFSIYLMDSKVSQGAEKFTAQSPDDFLCICDQCCGTDLWSKRKAKNIETNSECGYKNISPSYN
jgi:hypothetical protein